MPGRTERAQKRTQNVEDAEEPASILLDYSDSFASRIECESRFCEAGTSRPIYLDRQVQEIIITSEVEPCLLNVMHFRMSILRLHAFRS